MKISIHIDTDNPQDIAEAKRVIAEIEKGKKKPKTRGKVA